MKKIKYWYAHQPYKFQRKALKKAMRVLSADDRSSGHGFGLYMDPGTGKTKVAIDIACIMYLKKAYYRVLVICPVVALGVWEEQIEEHTPPGIPHKVFRLTGTVKEKEEQLRATRPGPELTWVLVNYESATRMEYHLVDWGPQGVILDEVHYIKHHTAKRSKFCHEFRYNTNYRLGLSGTPQPKDQLDHFSPFKFYDETILGSVWRRFRDMYSIWGGYYGHELLGFKNSKKLRGLIRPHLYRITKDRALDLPDRVYQYIPIELGPKAKDFYNLMVTESLVRLTENEEGEPKIATAPIILTQLLRLQQITSGFIRDVEGEDHEIGTEKIDACLELIDDHIESGKKVIVVCVFLWEIGRLKEALKSRGIETLTIHGDVSGEMRDKKRRVFQQLKDRYPVLIIQIGSALSIDLTAASTMIFMSVDHRLDHYIQSCDRIHRIGQKEKVTYLHLMGRDTVDERIYRVLAEKQNLSDVVLDNWRDWLLPGVPRH